MEVQILSWAFWFASRGGPSRFWLALMKCHFPSRTGIRGASTVAAVLGFLGWTASHVFHVTRYGEVLSFSMSSGYVALYWGATAEYRNSFVLNGFSWPYFPGRGAGSNWSVEQWGRWGISGPDWTLSARVIRHRFEYPQHWGLWIPGISFHTGAGPAYVGVPFWLPVAFGISGLTVTRRRSAPGTCRKCGYNIHSLRDSKCPECGNATRTAPDGAATPS
jgi:hypothetical protein